MKERHPGFTLIEVMIVLVLLGIVAMMAVQPTREAILHARVNRAATVIAGDLELAFSIAGRQRKPVRISVDPVAKTYTLTDRGTGTPILIRQFGANSEYQLGTLASSAATVDIFPNGLASQADTITAGSGGYVRRVTMTRAGLIRGLQ